MILGQFSACIKSTKEIERVAEDLCVKDGWDDVKKGEAQRAGVISDGVSTATQNIGNRCQNTDASKETQIEQSLKSARLLALANEEKYNEAREKYKEKTSGFLNSFFGPSEEEVRTLDLDVKENLIHRNRARCRYQEAMEQAIWAKTGCQGDPPCTQEDSFSGKEKCKDFNRTPGSCPSIEETDASNVNQITN